MLKQHYQQVQFIPNERRVGEMTGFGIKICLKLAGSHFRVTGDTFLKQSSKYISKIAAQTSTDFKMNSELA